VCHDVEFGFRLFSHCAERKGRPMSDTAPQMIVHASAVAIAGRGILILGASGAGKSALALALAGRGAALVSDDRVVLTRRGAALVMRAPDAIAGLIEARGVGLLRLPAVPEAVLALAVDLDRPPSARMPQPETITYMGISIELIFGREVPNLDVVLTIIVQNGRDFPESTDGLFGHGVTGD
jgi:HPr kinase/phosphorylase